MTLDEIRQKYPQYNNLSDQEVAYGFWNTYYKDRMPMGQFADLIKLSQPAFREMVSLAKESGYEPTGTAYAEGYVPTEAFPMLAARGAFLGIPENIGAASAAAIQKMRGDEGGFSNLYQQNLQAIREPMQQASEVSPGSALGSELTGGLLTGGALATGAKKIAQRAPSVISQALSRPIVAAPVGAGAGGFVYGTATSEGSPEERVQAGMEMVLPSMFFAGLGQSVVNLGSSARKRIGLSFDAASRRPTVDSLKRAKTSAYNAVDEAGVIIPAEEMKRLSRIAEASAVTQRNFVEATDKQTAAGLNILQRYANQDLTLSQLDSLRQEMSKRYKASGYSEPALLDVIDMIDDVINRTGPANELMNAARTANSKFKKAETIDRAFDKAERSAAASGTGGNVQNRYKQVINSILNNEREIRFFSQPEQALMRDFVEGDSLTNVARTLGKLDPSSGGLMLALNVGAAMADPQSLVLGATGALSRKAAEGSTVEQASRLFEAAGTGVIPQAQTAPMFPSSIAPITISEYEREIENIRGR